MRTPLNAGLKIEKLCDADLVDAAMCGNLERLARSIERGACIDGVDGFGTTALMHAAHHGHAECVSALLAAGSSVERENHGGWTAAKVAVQYGRVDCLALLVDEHLNKSGEIKQSLALLASTRGELEALRCLLERGVGLAELNDLGENGLQVSANYGRLECVKEWLAYGADVGWRDEYGMTAAIGAAQGGHVECLEALAKAGIDLGVKDRAEKTAEDWARDNGHESCAMVARALLEKQELESVAKNRTSLAGRSLRI